MRKSFRASICVAMLSAGFLVTATPGPAHAVPTTAVTLYGNDGSFGSLGGFAGQVPSGQKLTKRAIASWDVPGGQMPLFSAVAADGTSFAGGFNLNANNFFPTDDETAVLTFDPATETYRNLRIPSDTGQLSARLDDGTPAGAAISDVEAIDGGNAIAYVATAPHQDPGGLGVWPTFGVLTKAGGTWQAVPANQRTARQLADSNPTVGAQACPVPATGPAGQAYCRGLNELAQLPASRDIIVTQYTGGDDAPAGGLLALRVAGPDAQGRYTTTIRGHYLLPRMENPETPATDTINLAPREVQTDPTGVRGDERFTVGFDAYNSHSSLMEFSYDADTGVIRPVSPPFFPAGRDGSNFWNGGTTLYDHQGNLWVRRGAGFRNGPLAVYAKVAGQRRVGGSPCPLVPGKDLGTYTTTSGGRTVWGVECAPDFDILQPREPVATVSLKQNPVTRDVVALGNGGGVTAIRVSGSGRDMTFRIGTVVDLGYSALAFRTSPTRGIVTIANGAFDAAGRFRFWVGQAVPPSCPIAFPVQPCMTDNREVEVNHWLATVDEAQLFDPPPVLAPSVAGWWAEVQAEYTTTTGTVRRAADVNGTIAVDSDAYVKGCNSGCEDDGIPGSGFMLADDSGLGVPSGPVAEYRVTVPTAGTYELRLRAASFAGFTTGVVRVEVAGTTRNIPVNTGGAWRDVIDPVPVSLPVGVSTVRISAPPGGGGVWFLNHFILLRR